MCDFVLGLQGANAEAAIGVALSYVIEWWKGYANLSKVGKRLVFLGLCLVIPLAAVGVGILSCGQSAAFAETWWPALVAGLVAFGTGTAAHTRDL